MAPDLKATAADPRPAVPVILLSVFAGVWLDRRRRRPVLISCALGNAALIGLVPIAAATGTLSIGSGLMISLILMTSPAGWLVRSPVFRLMELPSGPPPATGQPGLAKDGENR